MAITIPFLLLLAGLALLLFGRRRTGWIVALAGLALFFVFGTGSLPGAMLAELQRDPYLTAPQWQSKNLIVVLGAGTHRWSSQPEIVSTPSWARARVLEGARLYMLCRRSGASCTLLTSGGDPAKNGVSEAETMADELADVGVPPGEIVREDKSRNTFQNAKFSAPLIQAAGYDQVLLVTSGFHLRRARVLFEFFGIKTVGAPADRLQSINVPLPVSFNFVFTDLAVHELLGLLQFHLYTYLGWNS